MLSAKSRPPMIGLLTGSFISANRSLTTTTTDSPSPRSPKNFDCAGGGVGLGIVAALQKSGQHQNEAPAVFSRKLSRSSPIPIKSPTKATTSDETDMETDSLEDYTIVTYHTPNKSYTKVHHHHHHHGGGRSGDDRSPFRISQRRYSQLQQKTRNTSVFHISPARYGDAAAVGAPTSDFLSCCNLCQKKLQGEDIYMYRGEKAFCSEECRYRQMVVDERTENCSYEASRAVDLSCSPYTNGQIFTGGILAI